MNEIELGVRIPVDNRDELTPVLETLVKDDAIVDFRYITEPDAGFPEIELEFEDAKVRAHYEARPRYPNDMDAQKGLKISRCFKYNRTYDQDGFQQVCGFLEELNYIRSQFNKAESFDATSYIDRVIS